MAELTITLDLSPADLTDLQAGWWLDSDADLSARVLTLLSREGSTPLLDAVEHLADWECWTPPTCPRCEEPCEDRVDNELYLGHVWHWRCATDHAHDDGKSHPALAEVD